MKFGQLFKSALQNEGYPPDWIESAISYSQLKKCINRLSSELSELGLDPETLGKLLKHVEDYNAAAADQSDDADRPFEYILDDSEDEDPPNGEKRKKTTFQPKLVFHVDEATGALHSAQIDEKTKRKLHMLAVETGMTDLRIFEETNAKEMEPRRTPSPDDHSGGKDTEPRRALSPDNCPSTFEETDSKNAEPRRALSPDHRPGAPSLSPSPSTSTRRTSSRARPGYRKIEIPLSSDIEFFTKLTSELSGLEALRKREEQRMHTEIQHLGQQVAHLTDPDRRANKKLLSVWRQIFQLYLEQGIFFGTTERDHSAHDAEKAQARYSAFCAKLAETGLAAKLKKKEATEALNAFMHINKEILTSLRFGEINNTAMRKILKKFDKRTALSIKTTLPPRLPPPPSHTTLARSLCASLSTTVLSHIPQIEDYSCPMCMDLKWRPVTLACHHTFCIRCLIVMQNNKQDRCPLCREKTVVGANSDNLDEELAAYLKRWFPEEVREKQRYNEVMAGVDQYGEVYREKCCVM